MLWAVCKEVALRYDPGQVVGENCPSYTYQILQGVTLGTLTPPLLTPRSLY